jgi:hypothetical protein
MRRIAKAVAGRVKAQEVEASDAWFVGAGAPTHPPVVVPVKSAKIYPFPVIQPSAANFEAYGNCVPISTLKAAAGLWSEEQADLEALADHALEWALLDGSKLTHGMFVAQVVGKSMEPLVPDGSYCLFRPVTGGSKQGRKLLVWHSGVTDAETGGQYTLKVYQSQKSAADDEELQNAQVILTPLNPNFSPIVLDAGDEEMVRAIAEFVRVL